MYVEILTPEEVLFEGSAVSATIPGSDGSFQILENHAPIISSLDKGNLNVMTEKQGEIVYRVEGGVVEVLKNRVVVLLEKGEEI